MESTCAEDIQEVAIACCACKYPFPSLYKVHADKHSADISNFHFPLPLRANEVITSEEQYMEVMEWLIRLTNNYKLLRKKLNQIVNGEALIDSAYQELLHFACETNLTIKQEFSAMKEYFRTEVEKAIQETRAHALERYTPVSTFEKLLWDNKPSEMPNLLFNFQALCVKEEIPAAFRVVFQCTIPGLEEFSIGGRRILSDVEDLGNNQKWRTNDQMKVGEGQQLLEKELQDAALNNEIQLRALRTELAAMKERNNSLHTQLEIQTHQLDSAVKRNSVLGRQLTVAVNNLQVIQADFQGKNEQCVALETKTNALEQRMKPETAQLTQFRAARMCYCTCLLVLIGFVALLLSILGGHLESLETAKKDISDSYQTIAKLEDEVRKCVHIDEFEKAKQDISEANQTIKELEDEVRRCVMTTDPPTRDETPIPDYSTAKSKAALLKFGPYLGEDGEPVLVKRNPVKYKNGVYIGQWNSRYQFHGYGKFLWTSGDMYEGQWRNDSFTGKGRYIWADGTVYVGEFGKNQLEGMGTKYYVGGLKEAGMWVDGKLDGIGSHTFGQGSNYITCFGPFFEGKLLGFGSCISKEGHIYAGPWTSEQRSGSDVHVWTSQKLIYLGELVDGLSSNLECFVNPEGTVYRGRCHQNSMPHKKRDSYSYY